MFFKCRVCAEKDQRIADLKIQVGYFKKIAFPDNTQVTATQLEADGIMSVQQHVIEIPDEFEEIGARQAVDEQSERDRMLSGTY